jgi:hypothetical protein
MAHYAFLDNNNIVTQVIVGNNENQEINWEIYYQNIIGQVCKRTSYNTICGVYYDPATGLKAEDQSKAFRLNYAGIGYYYDTDLNGFIPPKPNGGDWILEGGCWIEIINPTSDAIYTASRAV